MRDVADADRIRRFMRALGEHADISTRIYFTGVASAVLLGWRSSTIDVDIKMEPETDALFRAIPGFKETLQINVKMASPVDFIPVRAGWQDRSPFIALEGQASFHHFEPYAQALSKVKRGHRQDLEDVRAMLVHGLITPLGAWDYFNDVKPRLYRYPAIDPPSFERGMEELFGPSRP